IIIMFNFLTFLCSLCVLIVIFKRDISAANSLTHLLELLKAIKDPVTFKAGWVVLILLLIGVFGLEPLGVPVSAVAAMAAALLLAVGARGKVISLNKVLRGAPWHIVVFSLGMYLVVYGLRNAGLTDYIALLLNTFAEGGVWGAAIGTGALSALL